MMGWFGRNRQRLGLRLLRERLVRRSRRSARSLALRGGVPPEERCAGPLLLTCMRDEHDRLPEFFAHYRRLGVGHFLVVDNGSEDGTGAWIGAQPDATVWFTDESYAASRFGMDWLGALAQRYGLGAWCLTVDADELLVYPNCDTRPLPALTQWLESRGRRSFGALLLDMFCGPGARHSGGSLVQAPFFDAGNYRAQPDPVFGHDWVQGGPRERAFFARTPARAPALNKVPLVKWAAGDTYVSSTHHLLPRGLNRSPETIPSGVLLHTKFTHAFPARAAREARRREHYGAALEYRAYRARAMRPDGLWHEGAQRFSGWQQLENLGLMSRGLWV